MIKCKETNLNKVDIFQVKYGTINVNYPDTVYVNCNTMVVPKRKITQDSIDRIKDNLQELLKQSLINSTKFKNKYIMDFSLCRDTLKDNKKNKLKFEVYIEQDNGVTPFNEMKDDIKELVHSFSTQFSHTLQEHGFDVQTVQ